MKYLDPKADLTFKKIFGNHPNLVISLLNALLPLEEDGRIVSVEYLSPEQAPRTPVRKNSIVDVKCKDAMGRRFIVEMQMVWSSEYKRRVVFNAAKAYVSQLEKGDDYSLLQPVYSLNLVNDVFEKDVDDYYHYYRMVHERYTNKIIEGLNLVFVELPKFCPYTISEKRMMVLWLRFLTEIGENTRDVPEELLTDPDVRHAIEIVEESAYTESELLAYDDFWDAVRVEKIFANGAETRYREGLEEGLEKGREEGLEKGREEGLEKGREEGRMAERLATASKLKSLGMSDDVISQITGLGEGGF